MRRITLLLLVSVCCFNIGVGVVRADGMILPEALAPDYLAVRYHHVQVSIDESHAVTNVVQEFHNPHPFPVNGRYLFPVPPDALLSRFQATVDGQRQTITRQDPSVTNAALYEIVAQRRDPSLLQYADWETIAFDLSLPAGGSRQMSLEYEQVLVPMGGVYAYRYVLSTERYSSQPLEQVSVTVDIHSSSGLSTLYSSTHSVHTDRQGPDRARITWEGFNVRPSEDFELMFSPSEGGFGGGLLTGRRSGHDHFMFLFAPEADPIGEDVLPKDIVFVIDRSGSMAGEKIDQARNALHYILGRLNEGDQFSIIGFDHQLSVFSADLQPVTPEVLDNARRFVDTLDADGNTDIGAALQIGLHILQGADEWGDASQMVVFLTDGLPTAGVTDEGLIASMTYEANQGLAARLHVFGVGYDVNTHLLDRLAAENGGAVSYVQPGDSLESALTGFYERIAFPALTDLEIAFEGMDVSEVYPSQLPDLFHGASLLVTGRYRNAATTIGVRVRGRAGGERREFAYSLDLPQEQDTGRHDFVPRLWATRRVGDLLDQVRVVGEKPAFVSEIRELGLGYGLVTPYTDFVIEAQSDGAASAANMALYANQAELNRAWGQTTVQARVQNQLYQQATQADLASGANVVNQGQHSLAQIAGQNVDMALLQGMGAISGTGNGLYNDPLSPEWLAQYVPVDRIVAFGSQDYFDLADDPEARPFLQSGTNVIFSYQGKVVSVQDDAVPDVVLDLVGVETTNTAPAKETYPWLQEIVNWLTTMVGYWAGL